MKFEYFTFEVEPYLQSGNQPSFVFNDVQPARDYYTLTNPNSSEMTMTLTTNSSEGVRIPVHAVATSFPDQQSEEVKLLGHGSLLFAMGMEHAFKAVNELNLKKPIERVVIVMATNCHELAGQRYRAYFGLTIETSK